MEEVKDMFEKEGVLKDHDLYEEYKIQENIDGFINGEEGAFHKYRDTCEQMLADMDIGNEGIEDYKEFVEALQQVLEAPTHEAFDTVKTKIQKVIVGMEVIEGLREGDQAVLNTNRNMLGVISNLEEKWKQGEYQNIYSLDPNCKILFKGGGLM